MVAMYYSLEVAPVQKLMESWVFKQFDEVSGNEFNRNAPIWGITVYEC